MSLKAHGPFDYHGIVRLLGKVIAPLPSEIVRYREEDYRRGYIAALMDVRREREAREQMAYLESYPSPSKQELARISHAYDK